MNGACVVTNKSYFIGYKPLIKRFLNRENLVVLLLLLILIAIIVATANQSPLWIYQGF